MINPSASAAWPLLALVLAVLLGIATVLARPWWTERLRQRQRARPFPPAWRRILRQRVPAVARLPPDLQQRLKGHIQVFIAEKPFIGCAGQAVNDEVRITIAALACLLLLGQAQPRAHAGNARRRHPGLGALSQPGFVGGRGPPPSPGRYSVARSWIFNGLALRPMPPAPQRPGLGHGVWRRLDAEPPRAPTALPSRR